MICTWYLAITFKTKTQPNLTNTAVHCHRIQYAINFKHNYSMYSLSKNCTKVYRENKITNRVLSQFWYQIDELPKLMTLIISSLYKLCWDKHTLFKAA